MWTLTRQLREREVIRQKYGGSDIMILKKEFV